ncbi:MAG TPA: tryptophan synthase subunit alpha [Pirellulales bacterium]|jgi:tryptophan synthase alpha chain
MSAIDDVFRQLRAEKRKAFMPFVTAGDPDLEFTALALAEMIGRGANLCELGIPYSDPIADGPVIQASYTRALDRKLKLAQIFKTIEQAKPKLPAPIVSMVSYAIVLRHGPAKYVRDARAAGMAGMIVPDLPTDESEELSRICRGEDFSLVQLVAPTTPRERVLRIAQTSTGFLYYVSVTGITGERTELPQELLDNLRWLRGETDLPVCVGFGISKPEHVRTLAPVADGLIVGSAVVRRMAEAATRPRDQVLKELGDYVASLVAALN